MNVDYVDGPEAVMNGTGLENFKYIVPKNLTKRLSHGVLYCVLNTFVETNPQIAKLTKYLCLYRYSFFLFILDLS
jgi:hypothetical protein